MKKELLKGLTEEQIIKIIACNNQEEMIAYAKEQGIELTDEQLAVVSGGGCTSTAETPTPDATTVKCPNCGSSNVHPGGTWSNTQGESGQRLVCLSCYKAFHAS